MDIQVSGMDKLQRLLIQGGREAAKTAGRAIHDEALEAFAESQRQVPRDTGTLAGSGNVTSPFLEGNAVVVEIGYGGAAAPYALIVHEDLEARHDAGKKAKYLEDPVTAQTNGMGARITDKIESTIRGLS